MLDQGHCEVDWRRNGICEVAGDGHAGRHSRVDPWGLTDPDCHEGDCAGLLDVFPGEEKERGALRGRKGFKVNKTLTAKVRVPPSSHP